MREFGSIDGITDRDGWTTIKPDAHHDWLEQRDPDFGKLVPLALEGKKGEKNPNSVFAVYSMGVDTHRDAWVHSFGRDRLTARMKKAIEFYETQRCQVTAAKMTLSEATRNDNPKRFKWDQGTRSNLKRNLQLTFKNDLLRVSQYRPFTKQYLYFESGLTWSFFRLPAMFPTEETTNQLICVTGRGETVGFSVLITDALPNRHLVSGGRGLARYTYRKINQNNWLNWTDPDDMVVDGYTRIDNITDWCLQQFQDHYGNPFINKGDIWYYVYGVLHAVDFRDRFASDLAKDFPRIPFAPDFTAFKEAGMQLAELHLGYETCQPWPVEFQQTANGRQAWILTRPMRWLDKVKRDSLQVTPHVIMRNIPADVHCYRVNGRTPLEWAIDRLRIRTDKASGIVNDPNAWFTDDPSMLGLHLARLVTVSVESACIIRNLPSSLQ